jgi:hypothetical protein
MDPSPERLLDAALPHWDVGERHNRVVLAAPEAVWQALQEVTVRDLPLTRGLMRARALGRRSTGGRDRPVLDALPPGELARRAPSELLLGLVAPTSLPIDVRSVNALRPVDVEDFQRERPDGWVWIGMDFRLLPVGSATRLETETRVLASGPRAKRRFAAYWLAVRLGSGVIRRELLRAVAHRAEAAGG